MTVRKFLHINAIMLIASLVMSHPCYAGDLAKPQLTKWERFTHHPYASHIPTALIGGYGLYKSLSADGSSSWLPTLALTATPLWATYVQAKQRAMQRPALQTEGSENIGVVPRTSRWRFAVPLGAAALAASLSAYYNNNWLPGLWWGAGAAAIPTLCATGAALKEDFQDTQRAVQIIDNALNANFDGVTNIELIRWALKSMNDFTFPALLQIEYVDKKKRNLTINEADNLLKIKLKLLSDARQTDGIQFLDKILQKKPHVFGDKEEAKDTIRNEMWFWSGHQFKKNSIYEKIEDALLVLQLNNAKADLIELFKKDREEMLFLLKEYEKRTQLYKDAGVDVQERENMLQFMQEGEKEVRGKAMLPGFIKSTFGTSYTNYSPVIHDSLDYSYSSAKDKAVVVAKAIKDFAGNSVTWNDIQTNFAKLKKELTDADKDQYKLFWFHILMTEIKNQRDAEGACLDADVLKKLPEEITIIFEDSYTKNKSDIADVVATHSDVTRETIANNAKAIVEALKNNWGNSVTWADINRVFIQLQNKLTNYTDDEQKTYWLDALLKEIRVHTV